LLKARGAGFLLFPGTRIAVSPVLVALPLLPGTSGSNSPANNRGFVG
jgi:hypothetical protein